MIDSNQNDKGHWVPTTSIHWSDKIRRIDVITAEELKYKACCLTAEELLEYLKGRPTDEELKTK